MTLTLIPTCTEAVPDTECTEDMISAAIWGECVTTQLTSLYRV